MSDMDEIIKQQKEHTVAIVELQTLVKNGLTGKVNKIDNRMWVALCAPARTVTQMLGLVLVL